MKCPNQLNELIGVINNVPPTFEMADLFGLLRNTRVGEPEWANLADATLENCLKDAPEGLRSYIRPAIDRDADPVSEIENSVQRYCELREAREKLTAVARRAQGLRATLRPILSRSYSFRLQWIEIDEHGYVRSQNKKDLFTNALEEVDADGKCINVEAKRIRECVVCERIFWAGRLDKIACGEICSRRVSTDKWRKKYLGPEGYKLRRLRRTPAKKSGRPKISAGEKLSTTTKKGKD